ncbi:MAG: SHOCT domain-containing protein [Pirellulales bacterium]
MSLADELAKLDALRRDGALDEQEFALAKAQLLSQGDEPTLESVQSQLRDVRLRTLTVALDQAWELERKTLVFRSDNGHETVPSKESAWLTGGAGVVVGIVWIVVTIAQTYEHGIAWSSVGLGVIFIAAGIGGGGYIASRAARYENAFAAYRIRRARLSLEGAENDGLFEYLK